MKFDVTVVGAGPAGLSAAIELAQNGLSVAVIDEYFRPGGRLLGQLYDDPHAPFDKRQWDGKKVAQIMAKQAKDLNVQIITEVTTWTLSEGWNIQISGTTEKTIQSKALLLATGAIEKALPIPGWTLPGVYSIGAAQTFTNLHHIAIGKRVMVVGIDPLALSVVMEMKHAGIDVVGVALPPQLPMNQALSFPVNSVNQLTEVSDLAPNVFLRKMGKLVSGKFSKLAAHALNFDLLKVEGIPIHIRKAVMSIEGKQQVEYVTMQSVTVDGVPTGRAKRIEVDAVCLSAGLNPLIDLAQVAGCPIVDIPELGGLVPVHGPNLSTPKQGLFVAGNITGIEGAKVVIAQGKLAGVAISNYLGRKSSTTEEKAIKEVDQARKLAPIRFLPNIQEGREKMKVYWQNELLVKG
jgi:sarcosine oxidase, subunit alpha